jgi:hypothetical protein
LKVDKEGVSNQSFFAPVVNWYAGVLSSFDVWMGGFLLSLKRSLAILFGVVGFLLVMGLF